MLTSMANPAVRLARAPRRSRLALVAASVAVLPSWSATLFVPADAEADHAFAVKAACYESGAVVLRYPPRPIDVIPG